MKVTIEEALQKGIAAHKEGELKKAERVYRAILKSQPNHPEANHNLGVLAVSANKADAALPLFKIALRRKPKIEQFRISYIDALIKENQIEAAKQALSEGKKQGLIGEKLDVLEAQLGAIAKEEEMEFAENKVRQTFSEKRKKLATEKKERKAHKKMAQGKGPSQTERNSLLQYYQSGRFNDAERLALSLTQEFPDHQFGWKVLGALFGQTGRMREALAANQKAVSLVPKDSDAHSNLGNALKELGRLAEAEASYKQAIALKPNSAEAHNNLGVMLQWLGRLEEAAATYKKAIASQPNFANAHLNLGITLNQMGSFEDAEESYLKAIEFKSDYYEAYVNLGITRRALGNLEDAVASYEEAITLKSDVAEVHSNLGEVLHGIGRFEDSVASARRAIALKSDMAEAHNNLGIALKALGRVEEAIVSYTRAIELKSGYINALENRGLCFFDKGDFASALQDYDLCNTKDTRAYALSVLYALGRTKDIYERIESQLPIDEDNLRVAAFSSFISEVHGKDTAHNFCKNPLEFLHVSNISSHCENPELFIRDLIGELLNIGNTWEPIGLTTKNGFQSKAHVNLFENQSAQIRRLRSLVVDELNSYYSKFQRHSCSYIKKWPSGNNLHGWYVVLKSQGYQNLHIHPGGWLSGVIYLKVVPSLEKEEGSIELTLSGEHYNSVRSSKMRHQPKEGDIVLFPSSLHHRTIPFTTDTDRIIVAFDLKPS